MLQGNKKHTLPAMSCVVKGEGFVSNSQPCGGL